MTDISKEEFDTIVEYLMNERYDAKDKDSVSKKYTMEDFVNIIRVLRAPDGCPWDSVQTHDSITQCLIDECYEVIQAIKDGDDENLSEELGDVLMQVIMHSQIAAEDARFSLEDVVDGISRKMIRRHPKIFVDKSRDGYSDAAGWEDIKKKEKEGSREAEKGILGRIPESLPALIRASKVLKKNEKEYGEKKSIEESIDSIEVNMNKIREYQQKVGEDINIEQIIGETLLEITNISCSMEENAENSLTNVVEQFINKRESNGVCKVAYPKNSLNEIK